MTIYLYQELRSINDSNGNPRRVTMVYAPDGGTLAALDQGYSGDRTPDSRATERVVLPSVDIAPSTYREIMSEERVRGFARRYLIAALPTGLEHLGSQVDWRTTLREGLKGIGLTCKPYDLQSVRVLIWTLEAIATRGQLEAIDKEARK